MSARQQPLFTVGEFRRIYDPNDDEDSSVWHVNDHCFARDTAGGWHMLGITYPDPGYPPPAGVGLGHATSPSLTYPTWGKAPYALYLQPERDETVLWAPHTVEHDGSYWMFYCSGGQDTSQWGISLARSMDLQTWEHHPEALFRDGFQARDPMVLWDKVAQRWIMYYCATDDPRGGHHVVAYRTSTDLIHWNSREIAYADKHRGTEYGPTESPFVVRRGRSFYLLIGPRPYDPPTDEQPNWEHPGYDGTDVFRSENCVHWTDADYVGHIPAHAAEVVRDEDGKWYVSHCGIKRGGLYLAELHWSDGEDDGDCSL